MDLELTDDRATVRKRSPSSRASWTTGTGWTRTASTRSPPSYGDSYVVNGRKMWISKAQESEKVLLLTRTTRFEDCVRKTDGMTLFSTDLDCRHLAPRHREKLSKGLR